MSYVGIGVLVGVVIGIIVAIISIKASNSNGKFKSEYDERQEAILGKGFKYAAYTAWILMGVEIVLKITEINLPIDDAAMLFTMFCISLMVSVSHSIWKDAYFAQNNKVKNYIILFVVLALINGAAGIAYICNGSMVVNGVLTWKVINLECALLFVIIGIEYLAKHFVDRNKDQEEE